MTQELSTTGTLSLFETTKEQRASFVTDLMDRLDSGNVSPLVIHLQLKAMQDIISCLTETDEKKNKSFLPLAKRYKALLLESAQKYGAKSFDFHNAKFEIKEVGTKYDYSQCNDNTLKDLETAYASLGESLKARQKFLQTVPVSGMTLVTEDGEAVTVYPPSKSSQTSVAVTLK